MGNLVIILVLLAAIGLVIFLIKRNRKDRREFEDEVNRPDIRPEKHEEENEKI
jgi:preprotein translocase subunit YajC